MLNIDPPPPSGEGCEAGRKAGFSVMALSEAVNATRGGPFQAN